MVQADQASLATRRLQTLRRLVNNTPLLAIDFTWRRRPPSESTRNAST